MKIETRPPKPASISILGLRGGIVGCLLIASGCADVSVPSDSVVSADSTNAEAKQLLAPQVCGTSPSSHKKVETQAEPNFDTKLFAQTVTAGLGERLMGYAFTLQNEKGERIVRAEYGLARTACEKEGEQPFTIRTKTNWGSVAKMLTFSAAMHRIENGGAQGPYTPSMIAKIASFLPKRWRPVGAANPHQPGLADVEVWHLLEHRAGFEKTAPPPIWERLPALPEREEGIGVRHYSNTSATTFQAMPYFFDPDLAESAEAVYGQHDDDTYNDIMYYVGKVAYHDYVQKHLLEPLGISAQCNKSVFPDGNWSKYYKNPSTELGSMVDLTLWEQPCAAGGWMISTMAMGKFAHALSQTEQLISSETYDEMANTSEPGHRKGWASHHELDDGHAFSHNGSRWNGKAKGQMIVFPNGFVAVGASNSKPGDGPSLRKLFIQAYEQAWKPHPELGKTGDLTKP